MKWSIPGCMILIYVAIASACEPGSYEECIIDLGKSRSADEARSLCREAFPEPVAPEADFAGDYYYATAGRQCNIIAFDSTGLVDPARSGYCSSGSRIECVDGQCWFTCAGYNSSQSAQVANVERVESGLMLTPSDSTRGGHLLFSTRAFCEGQMLADRQAQQQTLADALASDPATPEGVSADLINLGEEVFHGPGLCSSCHGRGATGTALAPDLTDSEWLNVERRDVMQIRSIIEHGVMSPLEHPAPMPPRGGSSISQEDISAVAAYVWYLGR